MKAVQIVVDEELLTRVDHTARRLKSSRSAAFRRLVEIGLEHEALAELARKEARAYARKPASRADRDAFRALARSQQRVIDELSRTERW